MRDRKMWACAPRHRSLVTAAVLAVSSTVTADDAIWINADGGLFSDQLNWAAGMVPGVDDAAYFDLVSLYTVTFTADVTNSFAYILDDRVTFDLGGFTYALENNASPDMVIGGDPATGLAARLTVINGTIETGQVEIAAEPGSVGAVEVAGPGATWNIAVGSMYIGKSGTGSVDIINGASMIMGGGIRLGFDPGANGSLAVVGPASRFEGGDMTVGWHGLGSFFITNGGTVDSPFGEARVATQVGSSGSVFVNGAGSSWTVELHDLGERGPGYLDISDGGTVISTANEMVLCRDETGSAWITVSGAGSSLDGGVKLRLAGEGEILVEDGGNISGELSIAPRAGTQGSLIITGPTTTMTGGRLGIGGLGQPELTISDGATAVNSQRASVDNNSVVRVIGPGTSWSLPELQVWATEAPASVLVTGDADMDSFDGTLRDYSQVTITGAGSRWEILDYLVVAANDGGASLVIEDGASCESLIAVLADNGGSTGQIRVDGPSSTFDVLSDFTIGPGGEGTLSILDGAVVTVALVGGAYTQAATGHLVVELTPTSGVAIQVYGDANLAGSLAATLADGFDPPAGESFDIIQAWSIPDMFDDLILSTTPSGRELDVSYLVDRVRVTVQLLDIPGDVDGDESVGIQDFLSVLASWGPCPECTPAACPADIDGDCTVGIDDLLIVLANWS